MLYWIYEHLVEIREHHRAQFDLNPINILQNIWQTVDTVKISKLVLWPNIQALTCLTLGLPGENFLLVIAGFPIPIFGVRGMWVVVVVVMDVMLQWSLSEGRIWDCANSLWHVPRSKEEEWEDEETISASLSTVVLSVLSSEDRLRNDRIGLFSCEMSIFSNVTEAEGSTVSAEFLWKTPSLISLSSFGTVSRPITSMLGGWNTENSIGWSGKGNDGVLGSLVAEVMAIKSFVLGSTTACSEPVSVLAGLLCVVASCVCSGSAWSWVGKDSWQAVEDAGLSVDWNWVLTAGFTSVRGHTQEGF